LPRPHIGVAPRALIAVRGRVTGAGVDDRKIAHQPDLDVPGLKIPDGHGEGGLPEEDSAVDERLVGIGSIEIFGEDFVEAFDVRILDGIDVIAIERS
jgi:hypothetical protein